MTAAALRTAKEAKAETAQRRAARPDASVWVAASAGTGKTKVLTDRVLSLMLHGTEPARLLCLTFTKAAAAEMANRLAARLARWAAASDQELIMDLSKLLDGAPDAEMLSTARQLFARVLDAPGGMKIQTIHAFCQSLLGRFPLEADVPPHFQVLDERSAGEMLLAAREEVLAGALDEGSGAIAEALAEITAHAHELTFVDLLAQLLRDIGRLKRAIGLHAGLDRLIAALFRALGVAPGATTEAVLERASRDEALDMIGLKLCIEAMGKGGVTDRRSAAAIENWLAEPAWRVARFDDYLAVYFTQEGSRRARLVTKPTLKDFPGADAILAAEAERLAKVRETLNAVTVARATAALLRLGGAIVEAYERHKRVRALLDYEDLILKTHALLQAPGVAPWVLYKLDGGLDHLLIDEAQDTNPEQWAVIQTLTAEFFAGEAARDVPRTVFAVGDAKQSIFSFQRADPAAFEAMRAHFTRRAQDARQRMEVVDLDVSFRSTDAVLRAVDAVFAQPEARDGLFAGEAALHHDPVRAGQAGLVELWPTADPLEGDDIEPWSAPLAPGGSPAPDQPPRARLARLIARRIAHWTRNPEGAADPDSWLASKHRRLRAGDFLVLVRRRNAFVEELVRALKQLEVPVAGVDRMVLSDQLAVMDLVALGRVLMLPEDDLTIATVLKGPLIGLDEEQLFTLAYDRKGTLWDALRKQRDNPAFAAAYETLSSLRARADIVRPYELFAEILGALGSREKLLARLGPEANDPIDEFLSLALAYEREHVPALEGFLHWLEAGRQEIKRDMEHGQQAVRVMTVHGAKGLQAPVVILPDTLQTPPAPTGLFWIDDAQGRSLPLWPVLTRYDGPLAQAARRRERQARDQEYRRLLYVALTRAEDRLYVCGWNTKRAAPEDCWYQMIAKGLGAVAEDVAFDFTGVMEGGWAGPGWRLATAQQAPSEAETAAADVAVAETEVPDFARASPAREAAPPRPLAPSRPATDEPAVRSPLGADEGYRFHRGRIVHRLLETLPELPPERRRDAARRFLARPVLALSAQQRDEILTETLAVLEAPDFAALFGPGSRAEVPLAGAVPWPPGAPKSHSTSEIISGQIDRLLVTPESVTIVDYKTNRPPPLTEAQVAPLYVRQMAGYRAVIKEIYPDRPVRCLLLWTDGPRLMQLSDDLLTGRVA